jgi:hypothetical protein
MPQTPITRERLVDELAVVAHETWILQGVRDYGHDPAKLPTEVQPNDREGAELIVRRMEELGVVGWGE